MMNFITCQHLGLLLVIAGTVPVAFSVHPKNQYDKDLMKDIKRSPLRKSLISPTEVTTIRSLLWGGLVLIALGTLAQW